jgi:hypothetical protein
MNSTSPETRPTTSLEPKPSRKRGRPKGSVQYRVGCVYSCNDYVIVGVNDPKKRRTEWRFRIIPGGIGHAKAVVIETGLNQKDVTGHRRAARRSAHFFAAQLPLPLDK